MTDEVFDTDTETVSDVIDIKGFAALGSDPRVRILLALTDGPRRPTELADLLPRSLGLWHHMSTLIDVGLVFQHNVEPKRVLYYLNVEKLRQLADELIALADAAPVVPEDVLQARSFHKSLEDVAGSDDKIVIIQSTLFPMGVQDVTN